MPPDKTPGYRRLRLFVLFQQLTVAARDLNCKHRSWNNMNEKADGKALREYEDTVGIVVQGSAEPTHYDTILDA